MFVCFVLILVGVLSELVSIFELFLKKRNKYQIRNNFLRTENEAEKEVFLSESSILYNYSDESIKMGVRPNQKDRSVKNKKDENSYKSSDECLHLIKDDSSFFEAPLDIQNQSFNIMDDGVDDGLMSVGYETNINVIKYHPFDGNTLQNPQASIMIFTKYFLLALGVITSASHQSMWEVFQIIFFYQKQAFNP